MLAEVTAGKEIPRHVLQRLKVVVTLFSEQERDSVCERVLETLSKLLDHLDGSTDTIGPTTLLFVKQLLGVLSRLPLRSRHFDTLFPQAGRLMPAPGRALSPLRQQLRSRRPLQPRSP